MNIRDIKHVFLIIFFFCASCTCDISKKFPEFRLIMRFSERIRSEEGLTLGSYGVSDFPQKNSNYTTSDFSLIYVAHKAQKDIISLENARCLLVSITESFLKEINSDKEVITHLKN